MTNAEKKTNSDVKCKSHKAILWYNDV